MLVDCGPVLVATEEISKGVLHSLDYRYLTWWDLLLLSPKEERYQVYRYQSMAKYQKPTITTWPLQVATSAVTSILRSRPNLIKFRLSDDLTSKSLVISMGSLWYQKILRYWASQILPCLETCFRMYNWIGSDNDGIKNHWLHKQLSLGITYCDLGSPYRRVQEGWSCGD